MIANAAAPLTAHGGFVRGLGFHGVSSFDAISRRQRRRLPWHEQTRKVLSCSSSPGSQTRQSARSCGSGGSNLCLDHDPEGPRAVFLLIAAMVSTVRWLMPRSVAMFLLGCPASSGSKIWRLRLVRLATHVAGVSPNFHSAAASRLRSSAGKVANDVRGHHRRLRDQRRGNRSRALPMCPSSVAAKSGRPVVAFVLSLSLLS